MVRSVLARAQLRSRGLEGDAGFRWRGGEVSRIEAFSDAVFAFSLALLVISVDVPTSFDELVLRMRGFFAFAVCFTLLLYIWYNHYLFFRRFGLQTARTVALNGLLLFLVLFYTYPLKFLYAVLMELFGVSPAGEMVISESQMPTLMIIYSAGFLSIFLVLALMNHLAYSHREALELDEIERIETRGTIVGYWIHVALGALSIGIVLAGWPPAFAGFVYALLGPAMGVHASRYKSRVERLQKEAAATEAE